MAGDVEISVNAEGVEDAVGEVPDGEQAPSGGGGGGGGGLKRLLGIIAVVLTFAEDILKVVGVISSLLRAFLAPVAVLLLRLLQPVMRLMLQALPLWFDFMAGINDMAEKLKPITQVAALLGAIAGGLAGAKVGAVVGTLIGGFLGSVVPGLGTAFGAAIGAKVGAIVGGIVGGITGGVALAKIITPLQKMLGFLSSLAGRIWGKMKQLPGMIANRLASVLPGGGGNLLGGGPLIPGTGGGDGGNGAVQQAGDTLVQLSGGLGSFVENASEQSGINLF